MNNGNKEYLIDISLMKSDWEKDFKNNYQNFFLNLTYLVGLTIPLLFLVEDLIQSRVVPYYNYFIPFLVLLALSISYVLRIGKTSLFSVGILIYAQLGLFFTLFLDYSRNTFLMIFFVFPILSVSLRGRTKGGIWSLAHLISFLGALGLYHGGVIQHWNSYIGYSPVEYIVIIATYIIIWALSGYIATKNQDLLQAILYSKSIDPLTGYPNRFTLEGRRVDGYLFGILKLRHGDDIRNLLGDENYYKWLSQLMQTIHEYKTPNGDRIDVFSLNSSEIGLLFDSPEIPDEGVLEGIQDYVGSQEILYQEETFSPLFTIGYTSTSGKEAHQFFDEANSALITAQRQGVPYLIFTTHLKPDRDTLAIAKSYNFVKQVIINRHFKILYQPVFNSETGRVYFWEALFRMYHQDGTEVSYINHAGVIDKLGLESKITRIVFKDILQAAEGNHHSFSMNLTHHDIVDRDFMELLRTCEELSRHRIILELVETEALMSSPELTNFISQVKALGYRVAIDDFGSGSANIIQLMLLEVDILKLDGMVVNAIESHRDIYTLIRSLQNYCQSMDKSIVAEMVENEGTRKVLNRMGILYHQGYLYARPGQFRDFKEYLPEIQ